jgi:hypothetical protein
MVETITEQFGKFALPKISDWLIEGVFGAETINNTYGHP